MQPCETGTASSELWPAWFNTPLGRSLQAIESHRLRDVLPGLFGTVAIQLGRPGCHDLLEASPIPTRVMVDLNPARGHAQVAARPDALPFDGRSVDLALLPHTLDFCGDPHSVLRDVARVLSPEGHVVILGFNPFSLWGLRRAFARGFRIPPWNAHFLSLPRLKDWLRLLDFEMVQGQMMFYRPPLTSDRLRERLFVLDKIGDRWWPMAGAVYLLVAKKRVAGMVPIKPKWSLPMGAARAAGSRGVVVSLAARRRKPLGQG